MLKGGVGAVGTGRDFASGRAMFSVATCIQCHQIGGIGKTVGPDLTEIGKKYKVSEILEHIMDPSLLVEEEFKSVIIEMKDGKTEYFGTILEQNKKTVLIAQSIDDIPFDVRQRRVILYEFTPRGMVKFEESLQRALESLAT